MISNSLVQIIYLLVKNLFLASYSCIEALNQRLQLVSKGVHVLTLYCLFPSITLLSQAVNELQKEDD